MTDQTHSDSLPVGGNAPGGETLVTQVCYLPYNPAAETTVAPGFGLRAVEPQPSAKHAIRGNLYVTIEIGQGSSASNVYSDSDLLRVSERLLGLVQTTYYTAKGAQTMVMERAIEQVHQALVQINQEHPEGMLRAGITCAALLRNRLLISCSGPALALIASDEALEQFPWHQSEPDPTLGGSQNPEIHTYKREVGGQIALFIGSNRWIQHLTVRKLLGTIAQTTVDDCDEIAEYLSDEIGGKEVPAILIGAQLPDLPVGVVQDDGSVSQARAALPEQPNAENAQAPASPQPPSAPEPGVRDGGASAASDTTPASPDLGRPQPDNTSRASNNPLVRKRSSSLPTSVNAPPPIIRAPDEPETPHFEQTQEIAPTIEFRPGPSAAPQGGQQSSHPPADTERVPPDPSQSRKSGEERRSATPVRPLPVDPAEQPAAPTTSSSAVGDPAHIHQYSREGAAQRDSEANWADHSAQPMHDSPSGGYAEQTEIGSGTDRVYRTATNQESGSHASGEARPSLLTSLAAGAGSAWGAVGTFISGIRNQRATNHRATNRSAVGRGAGGSEAASQTQMPTSRFDQEGPGRAERSVLQAAPAAESSAFDESRQEENIQARKEGYTPPPPATGSRARLIISLAILFVFLIFVVVYIALWQQGADRAQRAEDLITAAQGQMNNVRAALDEGLTGTARESLQAAQGYLFEAERLQGPSTQVDTMLRDIETELQDILHVTRLYGLVSPLVTFPFEVEPHRVLVVDQDVYILDIGQDQIIRYRLDETQTAIQDQAGSVVLKQGQSVEGVTVGPLIDIAWQSPIPGVMDKANLLVLDSNNNIFRYNQRVEGPSLQTFGGQETWQTPTQIQTYVGRFYIADGGQGQIYRYSPGAYDQPPEPWLIAPNPEAISSLSTMMIDGDIWLLFNQGLLFPYHQGEQQPFVLDDDIGKISEPVDMFIGDQDSSRIYIADAGADRIIVFAKDGTYIHQLQAAEGNPLEALRGIFVDETARMIYMLTKQGLFQHPLVE